MKASLIFLLLITFGAVIENPESIYEFKMENIDGEKISLDSYKGKAILIVNVASKCGYTPQYEGLQALYEKYNDDGLVILGFPANNFKGQEPGTDEEIKQFCTLEYGVEFPMFSKVSVKGDDQAELFKYLTALDNPDFKGDIKWNFEKFLISKEGKLSRRFRSQTKPQSDELVSAIENELSK
ncbi:MAG: glutathione peroxidase [Balneola sp.]|nr:glutathione peroxidase [Balneola sp.]MBO6649817.1 glutathione peroxidase [Balneola sp.]MBO6712380.1 glutathione peroxidase [Balneola sp.]MBO6801469.1 glutathione peroxidase [Balneola sp.]MBO6871717.1 glutathione peroxidase [Balneola sp.]